ncbi:MAG: transcriptional regulator [Treponema sp. CETP13]|nr:MAG: transcriptional regulator [Treponema sp. CETP13]
MDIAKSQSRDDFIKAHNKAMYNGIQHFLNPDETELLSFSDIKKWLKPKDEIYTGMQCVPISLIVGSEGRYKDFDNHFFPKNTHLQKRWERIDQAHLTDIILPPIKLYELGGLYFVRDGNHRVSVAKSQGVIDIDAEVVSLQSEINLIPGMSKRQILHRVIDYEKKIFYQETGFGDITDDWELNLSSPGQYDVILNHILIHKYYINQNMTKEIEMHDAILSWYNNVYIPVIRVIKKQKIMKRFHKRTESDMYVWLIRYWDELKQQLGNDYSLDTAASQFKDAYGLNFIQRILLNIKKNKFDS